MRIVYNNDIELIKALKEGKEIAYNFLIDSYQQKLHAYAFGLLKDHELSEDVVQNIFVYIWKNRLNLKDDFSIKNYLYRAIYNECIDYYRKRKAVTALEKKYIDALNHVVEEADENSLEKLIALVKKEIENLPPKCKKTFILSKQEGLTNIEIAEYLNISIKSVEAHITKAFSILRKTLGDKTNGVLFLLFGSTKRL
ncbi:RNA polymerase sigma-70 factor [Litoribaculum gwangyangense]|uniref:RNA polymerase sigma-70 factor n=1 Tax=Litoribaculum gwangyangense TaxID=1130722 RepID=A0ABP9CEZ8_9FLAO